MDPNLIIVLIVALACPLAMLLMMRGHGGKGGHSDSPSDKQREADRTETPRR